MTEQACSKWPEVSLRSKPRHEQMVAKKKKESIKWPVEESVFGFALAWMEESEKAPQLVQVLEALKEATHDIQRHHSSDSPPIKALLQLHTILSSSDPNLSALSDHLNRLKTLVDSLNNSKGLRSFFTRPPLHALPLTRRRRNRVRNPSLDRPRNSPPPLRLATKP
ncbi:hypothetical protein JHK84_036871 [Glycine max]|nr:hypothetical protein JHK87_036379 [Glycine soja]KAG5130474.1 hypothetical protein JHK84_036871 [Glycine max]